MFTKADIDPAIESLDREIKNFAVSFEAEKTDFDYLTKNCSYIANERTVAFFANHKIRDYLESLNYQIPLFANEFSIKFNNGFDETSFQSRISEVEAAKQEKPWKRCFVDGYFKIKNFLNSDPVSHVFVEYKMENNFVYLDLATDYLKYKAITYAAEKGTIFVYIIFKREENYPSIISGGVPYYEIIDKRISKASVSGTKRVYVYLPNGQTEESKDEKIPPLETAISVLNEVTSLSDKVVSLEEKAFAKIEDKDLVFVKSMKIFNSKVAKSQTLRQYYPFIKELWDKCEEKKIFADPKSLFRDRFISPANDEVTDEEIIREGAFYKRNLGDIFTIEAKKNAIREGLRSGTNVSLLIVAILDFFNRRFEIGVDTPKYGSVSIRRGKRKEEASLDETVKQFDERLANNFRTGDEGKRKLMKLAYSIMYFIVHLFKIIYKIGENNEIEGYSENFEYYLLLDRLQKSLEYAMKKLGYKDTKVDVEKIMEDNKFSPSEDLLGFVNWVLKNY